jgi:hypothetical protein
MVVPNESPAGRREAETVSLIVGSETQMGWAASGYGVPGSCRSPHTGEGRENGWTWPHALPEETAAAR